MQIVNFQADHLHAVEPQTAQADVVNYIDAIDRQMLAARGMSFSALADGKIVGCAGVVELWPGVGQAWAVLSREALDEPITLTRAVLRELERIRRERSLHRVQATVADGHGAGARWLAFMGFEVEGLLINYGPGGRGDHWMYGMTT
ncbi:MAG: hypothetical protein JJ899_03070 [Alphaproteobacteria bacterium]|nr:hypothetical protein [Alphaproteobacteria bacterium]